MEVRTLVAGLPMPVFERIRVTPMTGACGAEIEGVDLRLPLPEATLAEIMTAFEHFLVIVFRDQQLTPEQHKAFSRHFGELMQLRLTPLYPGHDDMQEVRREAHEPPDVTPNTAFHTDSPFRTQPPLCIVMRALDAPEHGGDTAFSNMYLVYESLSQGLQTVLDGLRVVYSARSLYEGKNAPGALRMREPAEPVDEREVENVHNAVRRHPRSGRKALFVCRAFFKRFEGWSDAESKVLLDYLDGLVYKLKFQCRVRWKQDTLVVWDNRFTQHCGVVDYGSERRHLVRTTVLGERPL
jgi:alpha-ketoglutarate-dependent taurine dioxygenase